MKQTYDAVIVGGGHNGLTAAGYLGKAGIRTLVLERRPIVGGAVVTEEICPGYRISSVSYVVSLLRPEIITDLELKKHGFEMIRMAGTLAICNDDYLFLNGNSEHDRKAVGRFSSRDYSYAERRLPKTYLALIRLSYSAQPGCSQAQYPHSDPAYMFQQVSYNQNPGPQKLLP